MKSFKATLTLYFTALILSIILVVVYIHRYELNIVHPAYKVGDCFKIVIAGEFQKQVYYFRVVQVGRTHYLHETVFGLQPDESPIKWVDEQGIKLSCEDVEITSQRSK